MGCGSSTSASQSSTVGTVDTSRKAVASTSQPSTLAGAVGPPQDTAASNNVPSAEPELEINPSKSSSLTIVHFNDVYCVDGRENEPVGGAARFVTEVKRLSNKSPLVLFSGDCFSPSTLSNVTKGKHMVPVLNEMDVKAAVVGNHDFDFGVDNLEELIESTNAVWLLSNVTDKLSGQPLAGKTHAIIEWEGHKIGLMGLIEEEWLATLATVSPNNVTFTGFVDRAKQIATQLRDEGADIVIALTHMRMPNDVILAEGSQGVIDLVLGGHDHTYETRQVGDILVCKSGTDFQEFTELTIDFTNGKPCVETRKHEVTSDIPEDEVVKTALRKYQDAMRDQMEEVLDTIDFQLEGRSAELRTCETNLGNLVTDVMRQVTHTDVALINSGTMRSDAVHGPGQLKMKDLSAILPMLDTITVLEITGSQLISVLENGVSQYPKHEGRFPQVSGLKFSFDPESEPYSRVVKDSILVGSEPLEEEKIYKLCTKSYVASGKDGYEVLQQAKVLLDEKHCPLLPVIVQNHFNSVAIQRGVKKSTSRHIQNASLHSLSGDTSTYFYPKVEGRIKILHKEREEEVSIERDLKLGADKAHLPEQEKDKGVEEEEGKRHADVLVEGHAMTPEAIDTLPETDKPSSSEEKEELSLKYGSEQTSPTDTADKPQTSKETETKTPHMPDSDTQVSEALSGQGTAAKGTTTSEHVDKVAESQGVSEQKSSNLEEQSTDTKETSKQPSPKPFPPKRTSTQLKAGNITTVSSEDEMYALWEAVKLNDIEQVKSLISEGVNPSQLVDTRTVLHLTAEKDLAEVATYLLEQAKVNPDVRDEVLQSTPLHIAADGGPEEASFGSAAVAILLLAKGANINAVDLLGNTPLHLACSTGQEEVKKVLLEQNADTSIKNTDGETPAL